MAMTYFRPICSDRGSNREMSSQFLQKNVINPSSAPKRIAKIQFGTLQSYEIEKVSEMQVTCKDVYQMQPHRSPAPQVKLLDHDYYIQKITGLMDSVTSTCTQEQSLNFQCSRNRNRILGWSYD